MNNENAKEKFSAFWQKTAEGAKKAAEGAKTLAEQTKKNIHDQQAKKYNSVSVEEYKAKGFKIPGVIKIENDNACREFVDEDAMGWIEKHRDVEVFHIYESFVKKSGITFIPVPLIDNVYCADNFETKKFINTSQVFSRATEEKLAELRNIAYSLGAKMCSIEIAEEETEAVNQSLNLTAIKGSASATVSNSKLQSGATFTHFEGHDNPTVPTLKWFEHDENIQGLIRMRCNRAIKSDSIKLKGSSSSAISLKVACAIDTIVKGAGKISMEKEIVKEHNKLMIFEVEF